MGLLLGIRLRWDLCCFFSTVPNQIQRQFQVAIIATLGDTRHHLKTGAQATRKR